MAVLTEKERELMKQQEEMADSMRAMKQQIADLESSSTTYVLVCSERVRMYARLT